MEGHKVLLTTSGLGSRLGSITSHTNKSLVRVGDKPALSHIIDSYDRRTKFVVTVGHHGDKVRQYLEMIYGDRDIEVVEVDRYEGPGSCLGYSISLCEDKLQCPFIFHACDTILASPIRMNASDNWLAGCHKRDEANYRTLELGPSGVLSIKEKGEMGEQCCYIGVAGINDYGLFFKKLRGLLDYRSDVSDADAINLMIGEVDFEFVAVEDKNWCDIGNTTNLALSRHVFKSSSEVLEKDEESIFFLGDRVVKFFSDSKINKNRVKRSIELKGVTPEVIDHKDNFYVYRRAEGEVFSKTANPKSFSGLMDWASDSLWESRVADEAFKRACVDFYKNKTMSRVQSHLGGSGNESVNINGLKVPGTEDLLSRVNWDWLCDGVAVRFHGDFILDNIIETESGFVLIDWRQDFGGLIDKGDLYYDLAKMNHNLLVSHDLVNKDMFINEQSCESVSCDIACHARLAECRSVLSSFVKGAGLDMKKIDVLTSIVWLNMSGVHKNGFGKFLFNWGRYHLALALDVDT
jgi:NDP-sugar pyrophosphorylase family protein